MNYLLTLVFILCWVNAWAYIFYKIDMDNISSETN
jgi:hypothetical protein